MSDQFWKAKNDYRRSQLDVTILIVESSSLEVGYLIYIHSCTVSANINNMLRTVRVQTQSLSFGFVLSNNLVMSDTVYLTFRSKEVMQLCNRGTV